jgi:hypothetical protein
VQKVFASSIVSARAYCATLASSNASSFPSALLAFAAARYLDCRSRAVIAVAPIGGRPPCGFDMPGFVTGGFVTAGFVTAATSSAVTVGLMTGFGGSSADVKRNMVNSPE